jgi:hypothetical protein
LRLLWSKHRTFSKRAAAEQERTVQIIIRMIGACARAGTITGRSKALNASKFIDLLFQTDHDGLLCQLVSVEMIPQSCQLGLMVRLHGMQSGSIVVKFQMRLLQFARQLAGRSMIPAKLCVAAHIQFVVASQQFFQAIDLLLGCSGLHFDSVL